VRPWNGPGGDAEAVEASFATDFLSSLREDAKNDDGRESVMVNLIRYGTKAVTYPGGGDERPEDDRWTPIRTS
jgi:hypothetical protein